MLVVSGPISLRSKTARFGPRAVDLQSALELSSERRTYREKHLGQLISGVVIAGLMVVFVIWALKNPAFEWAVFGKYFSSPHILDGVWTTIWLTCVVVAISVVFGFALASFRLSGILLLVTVAWGYVWIFRSIPVLVQLLLWFNIGYFIPAFTVSFTGGATFSVSTNDLLTATTAAILGLSLHGIAIAGEIIRGGFLSISPGQAEAARVLGLSEAYIFRRVVFPQSLRSVVPALASMFIEQLKGTSIVSVLAVSDLLYSAQSVYASNYKVVPLLMVVTLWYIVITSVLSACQYLLERALSRSDGRADSRARVSSAGLDSNAVIKSGAGEVS